MSNTTSKVVNWLFYASVVVRSLAFGILLDRLLDRESCDDGAHEGAQEGAGGGQEGG